MSKFGLVFLIFCVGFQSIAGASIDKRTCYQLLTTELTDAKSNGSYLERISLSLLNEKIKKNVIEACWKNGTCTQNEAISLIRSEIEKTLEGTRRAKAYSAVIATMLLTTGVSTGITHLLPDANWSPFVAQLITQISLLVGYAIGAPVIEPLSSHLRQWIFEMGVKKSNDSQEITPLEQMWRTTQAIYSANAQMSRSVEAKLVDLVHDRLDEARKGILSSNANDRLFGIDQAAALAVQLRRLFLDVPVTDQTIQLIVHTNFLLPIVRAGISLPEIKDAIRSRIQQFDPDHATLDTTQYYETLLDIWLTPPANYADPTESNINL